MSFSHANAETEFKVALHREEYRRLLSGDFRKPDENLIQTNLYLDTPGFTIKSNKMNLRLRLMQDGAVFLAMKGHDLTASTKLSRGYVKRRGLHHTEELECEMEPDPILTEAIARAKEAMALDKGGLAPLKVDFKDVLSNSFCSAEGLMGLLKEQRTDAPLYVMGYNITQRLVMKRPVLGQNMTLELDRTLMGGMESYELEYEIPEDKVHATRFINQVESELKAYLATKKISFRPSPMGKRSLIYAIQKAGLAQRKLLNQQIIFPFDQDFPFPHIFPETT